MKRSPARRRLLAVVTALSMFATGCSTFGGGDDSYVITAEVSRAYALFPGSAVRVLGVDVGTIQEIRISPDSDSVFVDLKIDGQPLPVDVTAIIIPETLLGERYVQLHPAYEAGATLQADAVIPRERTIVPREFDEILESLNNFVGGLDENEVSRLVSNLADVIDENGALFGQTIDAASGAIKVLQDNDDDLIRLASRLSDLNETISSRDDEIAKLLRDYNTLISHIVNQRGDLDAALVGLVRLTSELGSLLDEHRPDLERDIETLTRLTRTSNRNIDQLSLAILSSAELFGHADRVFDYENNLLPLVDHAGGLANLVAETTERRLVGLCERLGVPGCDQIPLSDVIPDDLCLPPLIPCPSGANGEPGTAVPMGVAVADAIDVVPGFREALEARRAELLGEFGNAGFAAGIAAALDARDGEEASS